MSEKRRAHQVELAARGDQDALQQLIVYYHGPLHGVVSSAINGFLAHHIDPDDILQEVYFSAFKSIEKCSFAGPGAFYKWLEKLATNQVKNRQRELMQLKRDVRRNALPKACLATSIPGLLERIPSPHSTPSRQLAKAEASAAVLSCFARLTDEQREVVRLRFLEGRPVADIAKRLGKTDDAIHKLCFRGLKSLGEMMASITKYLSQL